MAMAKRIGRKIVRTAVVWDVLVTLVCLYMASVLRQAIPFGNNLLLHQARLPWQIYVAVACIWAWTFFFVTPPQPQHPKPLIEILGSLLGAVCLATLAFAGLLYLSLREVSRLQFVYFAVLDYGALLMLHVLRQAVSKAHVHGAQRRVLLVGGGPAAQQLIDEFAARPWAGITIVGFVSDAPADANAALRLGPLDSAVQLITTLAINEVVFTLEPHAHAQVARLALACAHQVTLHMVPSVLDLAFRRPVETLGGIPLIGLREGALDERQRFVKRVFDAVASGTLLLLFAPLMLLIALLIKWESPGPMFFLQDRIGERGRRFRMIKFRSMQQDASRRWHEVMQYDAAGHVVHKTDDDPRITRIGRTLRRMSLDELPQLINVLRGDMSLVGPRPELPYIVAGYEPWQWQRFAVPAGMTGWWQINGRSAHPMHLHTEDDLYYIDNYSFQLDLKILWKTIGVVFSGQGAF